MKFERTLESVKFLSVRFYGNSLAAWIAAAVVLLAAFLVLRTGLGLLEKRRARLAAAAGTKLDDLLNEVLRATRTSFLLVLSLYAGSLALVLGPRPQKFVSVLATIALLWQAGIWGTRVLDFTITELLASRAAEGDGELATMKGAVSFLGRLGLWSLVIVLVLSSLNVNVTTLIAGFGVGGIAVALAVQNLLGDLFASFSIILDQPFAVGHFIVVDNLAGTVEHVGIKSTRIRSLSGEELVISNGDLLKARIHNFRSLSERRVLFSFGIVYDTPYEKLEAIPAMVRGIIERMNNVRFDRAHFKEYGDSSLNFEVVYYVLSPDYTVYMDIQQAINLAIFKKFQDEGIGFAFPTREVYVHQAGAVSQASAPASPTAPGPALASPSARRSE